MHSSEIAQEHYKGDELTNEPDGHRLNIHVHANKDGPTVPPWSFASVLYPITLSKFYIDYWGKIPLHIAREQTGFYSSLITLAEIERYLSMQEIFKQHSINTPRQGYGIPDPPPSSVSEVYERLLAGSSLRIRRMETFLDPSSPVILLLRNMELSLQHPLDSLSCYIAPPNAVGLGPHFDETEIFTLQISGMKRWRIYHRIDLDQPGIIDKTQLGAPTYEIDLYAGDFLYMPRGWIHDVSSNDPAFSLTIVFDPFKWNAIFEVLMAKLAGNPAFIAPLPAGVLLENQSTNLSLHKEFEVRITLIKEALEAIRFDEVVDHLALKLIGHMTLPPDTQLDALFQLEMITLETIIEKRPGVSVYLTQRDSRILLVLPGGYSLQVSLLAVDALESILATDKPFRIAEMHNLSDPDKIALAKKLVTCGLLRVVQVA